ncbi:hypothetical protein HYFRA_00004762 [Hymenoscyphus fraxineus]|uniref:AB hydrolase-1 domain-containing protein n=1 Tax=Hymenoscyphus fraxineus TaxID=746836 RepID=A0A9N9KNB6_9HELO|nr:hypothetical protein HYFRA_00004762 [Hymenoscyphus fraxineus]
MSIIHNPVLPHPLQSNGETSIPAPPASEFDALFGGVLPKRQTITTYWGTTTYYLLEPSHPSPDPHATPRKAILIHGVGTPAIGLLPLATLLAASSTPTTVLIYDNWGHGLSSTPLTTHVTGLFHTQILALLTHLRWEKAHFLGYSLGGMISASFAQFHPELVESLVLVAPAGLLRKSELSPWMRFLNWGGWGWGWEGVSARGIYGWLGPGPVDVDWEGKFKTKGLQAIPRERVQIWEKEVHRGHVASLVSSYRYCGIFDGHESYVALVRNGVPVLVLLGESDPIFEVGYVKKELEALGWEGRVEVLEGVGHGVVGEKTTEVEGFMLKFWESLGEE